MAVLTIAQAFMLSAWAAAPSTGSHGDRLREIDDGPGGCWVVTGTAQWKRDAGRFASSGSASFEATLNDHAWTAYRLSGASHATKFADVPTDRLPLRQFLFVVGDDPVVSAEVPGWRTIAPLVLPPFLEDVDAGGQTPRVVTSWQKASTTSDEVHLSVESPDGRSQWSWLAEFPHEASGGIFIRFEGDSERWSRKYVPFGYELRVRSDGFPASSHSWNQWGSDDVTFSSFDSCPPGGPSYDLPLAGALFEDERPSSPGGGPSDTRLIHAIGRRELVLAERRHLADVARRSFLGGGFGLGTAGIAFGSSFGTGDDRVLKGAMIGAAATLGTFGAFWLLKGAVAKSAATRRLSLLGARSDVPLTVSGPDDDVQ